MNNINLDFCIIQNPFSNGNRNIIFVTEPISKSNEKLLNSDIYVELKEVLKNFRYTETSELQFESSNNFPRPTIDEMIELLEGFGLQYNREFEVDIVKKLNKLKKEEKSDFSNVSLNFQAEEKSKNELIESKMELLKFKNKEPKIGKKVCLYFYLFLEFGFNPQGKPMIQFGGDFNSSKNKDDRNYIKIATSEFERINNTDNPNLIALRSVKRQKDLIKESGILYSGHFKYKEQIETNNAMILRERKFPYKLAEVKRFIKSEQPIIIETNRVGYDGMIEFSERIKSESKIEYEKTIPICDIESKIEELSRFLDDKIQSLSEKDEFEEAAIIKKDSDIIKTKIKKIKTLNKKEITTEEYFKLLSL